MNRQQVEDKISELNHLLWFFRRHDVGLEKLEYLRALDPESSIGLWNSETPVVSKRSQGEDKRLGYDFIIHMPATEAIKQVESWLKDIRAEIVKLGGEV